MGTADAKGGAGHLRCAESHGWLLLPLLLSRLFVRGAALPAAYPEDTSWGSVGEAAAACAGGRALYRGTRCNRI